MYFNESTWFPSSSDFVRWFAWATVYPWKVQPLWFLWTHYESRSLMYQLSFPSNLCTKHCQGAGREQSRAKTAEPGLRWFLLLALPLPWCGTWGKQLYFTELFPHTQLQSCCPPDCSVCNNAVFCYWFKINLFSKAHHKCQLLHQVHLQRTPPFLAVVIQLSAQETYAIVRWINSLQLKSRCEQINCLSIVSHLLNGNFTQETRWSFKFQSFNLNQAGFSLV